MSRAWNNIAITENKKMQNVNYTSIKLHANGLEILKSDISDCRIISRLPKNLNLSKRGNITTFSAKSAHRLRQLLLDIDFNKSWAICLTLPRVSDSYNTDYAEFWHSFTCLYRSRFSNAFLWRVELQLRGVPHWHLVFCGEYKDSLELKFLWHDFVSKRFNCNVSFFLHSVKVQQVYSGSSALMYLTAHLSKHKSSQLGWKGRQWGIVNRHNLHFLHVGSTIHVPESVWRDIVRQFRRLSDHLIKDGKYTGAFGKSNFRRMIFGRDEDRFLRIYRYYFDRWRDSDKMSHSVTKCPTM